MADIEQALPELFHARAELGVSGRHADLVRSHPARASRMEPEQYEVRHAPKGGVTVQGTFYPGGEFIPPDVMAKATPTERQAIKEGEKPPVKEDRSEQEPPRPSESPKVPGRGKVAVREAAKRERTTVGKVHQDWAEHNEWLLAGRLRGDNLPDNEPVDVMLDGPPPHGIECKSLLTQQKGEIRMTRTSRLRKWDWQKKTGGTLHTIVFDHREHWTGQRPTGEQAFGERAVFPCWYARGLGNLRVATMHRVENARELRRLMSLPEDQLPEAARPRLTAADDLKNAAD